MPVGTWVWLQPTTTSCVRTTNTLLRVRKKPWKALLHLDVFEGGVHAVAGAEGVADGVADVEKDAGEAVIEEATEISVQKTLSQPFQLTFPLLNRFDVPALLGRESQIV